jgi:hypothetical protein
VTGGYEVGLSVASNELAELVGGVTARGLRIETNGTAGISVGRFASLSLSNSRVHAGSEAIVSGGAADVSRSVLETIDPDSVGLLQSSASGGFNLDHVTVAHRGAPSGTDTALLLNSDDPDAHTRLHAVALAGYTRGIRRVPVNGVPHPISVTESVWDSAHDELGGLAAGAFVESGNAHVAPALVDLAGGDLRPRAGSAVIDRDSLTDVSQYLDLEGSPASDGDGDGVVLPDAGAIEFRPVAPVPAPAPPAPVPPASPAGESGAGSDDGESRPTADLTAPALTKLGLKSSRVRVSRGATLTLSRARRLRLVFSASEAATIKVVPRRVIDGRLASARGAIAQTFAVGNGSIALGKGLRRLGALRPGRLRLIVTATDAAGNRSPKRVLKLRLRK